MSGRPSSGQGVSCLVAEMDPGELTTRRREGIEVVRHGDAGDHLLQVGGEPCPVLRGVEQAVDVVEVDVVEDVLFGEVGAVAGLVPVESGVGDGVAALIAVVDLGVGEQRAVRFALVVLVEREALAAVRYVCEIETGH
jgi:hypothetical protein